MNQWLCALELIAYSLINFLPCFLLALYPFRGKLRSSPVVTVLGIAANAIIHTVLITLQSYSSHDGLIAMGCSVIHALFMVLLIKDHFGKSLFTLLMMTNLSNFIHVASKCLEGILFPDLAIQFHRWSDSLCSLIVEAVLLVPLFFYIKNVYTKAVQKNSSQTLWRSLWLIPLTFYSVWFRNFYFSAEGALTLALRPQHTLFSFVINAGALLSYYMVAQLINEYDQNTQLREREHQLSMQHAQYANLQDRIDEARRAKHDIRQHMHVISAYIKDQKYKEAEEYIARYRKTVPEESTLQFCENYAVNALLQYFAGYAKMTGAGFSAHVQLSNQTGIPDEILSVLLGNLLENATEACVREGEGSLISVRGKQDETAVFFKIVNTCSQPPKTDKTGHYLSSKRKGPGIGLRSVNDIAETYGGLLKAHWEEGTFTVSVMLTVPQGNS